MERNELDKNAFGGTELMGAGLERHVNKELLSEFQIIRSRVRDIDESRKQILWLHDLPGDPESEHLRNPASRNRFKKIVMVSNWQMQMYNAYLGVPYSDCVVLKNAIEPFKPEEINKDSGGKIKLIYHPTPHRGLNILVPVFDALCKKWGDKIQLDVYSSFKIYGWEERDRQFESLIQACKDHPQINYHGSVPNDVLRKALGESHIFAYPSTWQETSCICAIEAMSASNLIVTPNLAALPETTGGFAMMYQYQEDLNAHANLFYQQLDQAIDAVDRALTSEFAWDLARALNAQKAYADAMYNWKTRAAEWTQLLESLK
jgi:glycosyltransferase involved in cell wall biosynthesis